MKLKRFLLRYFPPGIILEYQRTNGEIETKSIDLLNLTQGTDIDSLVSQILIEEPMISEARRPQLNILIQSINIIKNLSTKSTLRPSKSLRFLKS